MMVMKKMATLMAGVGLMASGSAQAALFDRGGGLLYDTVLNVTWLQDANYAKTLFAATGGAQGDEDGLMNWSAANTWAGSLNISRFAGESLTGWRLAANTPVGADWNDNFSYDGSTDVAYNITSPHSELSYMYYVNLGLKGYYSPTGDYQPDYGIFGNGTVGQNDVGPVKNLQSFDYWSGSAYTPAWSGNAWVFTTYVGYQEHSFKIYEFAAWAVRPGDVAAVPEPEAYALLMAGLGLLGVVAKRRRRALGCFVGFDPFGDARGVPARCGVDQLPEC